MLLSIIVILAAVGADQLTKYLAVNLLGGGSVTVIPKVLDFTYVENKGAAFGMLSDKRWIFLIISTVMIFAIGVYLFVGKKLPRLERVALALIVGGGIGNMIDRVALGYVVDFIDVTCVKFYVFNVADSCVTVGCALVVLWCIIDTVKDAKAAKAAEAAGEAVADKAEEAAEAVEDKANDITEAVEDKADAVGDIANDIAEAVEDAAEADGENDD